MLEPPRPRMQPACAALSTSVAVAAAMTAPSRPASCGGRARGSASLAIRAQSEALPGGPGWERAALHTTCE